jgi:hypothetical protein
MPSGNLGEDMKNSINGKELHNLYDTDGTVIQTRAKQQRDLFVTIYHADIIG